VLEVHRDWSPLGAQRFIDLVEDGFYDGAPWFRVIEGFVAQCGISADPEKNLKWGEDTFADEPVVKGNEPGYLAFGKSGLPDSRSTHIFINYRDNSGGLDPQGFSCFAKVHTGMELATDLHKCEWNDQYGLTQPGGLEKFKKAFPEADFITKAYVVDNPEDRK